MEISFIRLTVVKNGVFLVSVVIIDNKDIVMPDNVERKRFDIVSAIAIKKHPYYK